SADLIRSVMVTLVAVAALLAAIAQAQTPSRQARVGVLIPGSSPVSMRENPYFLALRDGLAQLGYREGPNLVLELRAAERQTALGGDPVAMGLAQSIAHPGGNFTGFLHGGVDRAKLLQLLQEALPGLTRGGVIWNPDNPVVKDSIEPWDTEARARGLSL